MAWIEGLMTTPDTILKDLATQLVTANTNPDGSVSTDNWKLVYPRPFTINEAQDEALTATDGTNKIFQASASHRVWYPWKKATIKVGGLAASDYTINYATGTVTFLTAQAGAVTASFQYETTLDVKTVLATITNRVVVSTTINAQTTGGTGSLFTQDPNASVQSLKMYVEFVRPSYVTNPEGSITNRQTNMKNNHYVNVRMFEAWNDVAQDIYPRSINSVSGTILEMGSRASDWSKLSWFQDWTESLRSEINGSLNVDDITQGVAFTQNIIPGLYGDAPIQLFLSTNSQRVAMIVMGDPTLDYDSYMISFGYIGRLDSFTYDTVDSQSGNTVKNYYSNDTAGNFGLTVSSATMPVTPQGNLPAVTRDPVMNTILSTTKTKSWGENTGTGVTDIVMYRTRSGVYYQKHSLSFITPDEYINKEAFNPSRYTGKFHLSPAYVLHGYDGYRGMLKDVVVVDNSSINHLDDLVVNQGQANEQVYKYFRLNAPFSVFQDSGNWHYGVAIKKI